jgi:hypothetical protein
MPSPSRGITCQRHRAGYRIRSHQVRRHHQLIISRIVKVLRPGIGGDLGAPTHDRRRIIGRRCMGKLLCTGLIFRFRPILDRAHQNLTRENLIMCLSVKNTTALTLEKCGQAIGYALLSPGTPPDQLVRPPHPIQIRWFYILREYIRAFIPFGLRYGKITKEPFASISVGDFERLVCTMSSWAGMSKRISFSCEIFIQPNAPNTIRRARKSFCPPASSIKNAATTSEPSRQIRGNDRGFQRGA